MNRHMTLGLLLTFPLLGFVCDQSYAPALQNNLERSVNIEATYSNGHSFSQEFPAGARIWAPQQGLSVSRLVVTVDGGKPLFDLGTEEIQQLTSQVPTDSRIVWMIDSGGIRAVPVRE